MGKNWYDDIPGTNVQNSGNWYDDIPGEVPVEVQDKKKPGTGSQLVSGGVDLYGKGSSRLAQGLGKFIQAPIDSAAELGSGLISAISDKELAPQRQVWAQDISRKAQESRDANVAAGNAFSEVGKAVQDAGVTSGKYWDEQLKTDAPDIVSQQKAIGDAEGFFGKAGAMVSNPMGTFGYVAESMPDMMLGMGSGMAVGKIGRTMAASEALAAGRVAAQESLAATTALPAEARVAAAIKAKQTAEGKVLQAAQAKYAGEASAVSESASSTLSNDIGVTERIAGMRDEDLIQNNAYYAKLRNEGVSEEEAKGILGRSLGAESGLLAGIATYAGNKLTGSAQAQGDLIASGRTATAGQVLKNTGKESLEEGVQNPGENYAQYRAVVQADPNEKFDLGGSIAEGLVTGGAMGAAMHGTGYAAGKLKDASIYAEPKTPEQVLTDIINGVPDAPTPGATQVDQTNLLNQTGVNANVPQPAQVASETTQANDAQAQAEQTTAPAGAGSANPVVQPNQVAAQNVQQLDKDLLALEQQTGLVSEDQQATGAANEGQVQTHAQTAVGVSAPTGLPETGAELRTDAGGMPSLSDSERLEVLSGATKGATYTKHASADIPARPGESKRVVEARRAEAQALEEVLAEAGITPHFVSSNDGKSRFAGLYVPGMKGHVFIDVTSNNSIQQALRVVGAHEALHAMREVDPDFYNEVVSNLKAAGVNFLSKDQFQPLYSADLQNEDHATEEQSANIMGNVFNDEAHMGQLFSALTQNTENGTVAVTKAAKLVAHIKKAFAELRQKLYAKLDKIRASRGKLGGAFDVRQYVSDIDKAEKVMTKAFYEFAKKHGKSNFAADAFVAKAKAAPVGQPTPEKENREGVIVGARPGEFDWSVAAGGTPAPIQHPVQLAPRVDRLGPAVHKILGSKQVKSLIEDAFGVTDLKAFPTLGSFKGKPEPSFVLYGENLTFDAATGISKMLGAMFAQESTIVTQPVYAGDEDTWPAFYVGSGKKLTAKQIEDVRNAAQKEGLDYTTSIDGMAVKFFFDGGDFDAFANKVGSIATTAGLKNVDQVETRSQFNAAETYIAGGTGQGERQVWVQEGGAGSSSLFGRTVDHLLVPYAKAVGAEGYRFSPDLFADRFGLSSQQREYIRAALRPKNGTKLSTAAIVAGTEPIEVTKNDFRAKKPRSNNTDVLFALQNRAAQIGQIEPGDYSDEAKKAISQAMADEVVEHLNRPGGKSAIGWYDAALKRAKKIYHQIFPELETNPDREMLFDALLGIASQGNDVHQNSVFAGRMYHLITRENNTISEAVSKLYGSFGGETRAIENNFLKLEELLDRNGYDAMRKAFNKKMTVGEWNAKLRRSPDLFFKGEALSVEGAARQKVNGWMVFGPKIGSFINNLHGDYSTLTADLWFSRTWNRILGFSFLHVPLKEADKYQSFKEALAAENSKTKEPRSIGSDKVVKQWEHGEDVSYSDEELDTLMANPDQMLALAQELYGYYKNGFTFSHKKEDKGNGFTTKSDLRRAAKNWIEFREGSVAAPRTDSERTFQQETAEEAQKIVKRKTGEQITIADIQAALWYHEKELFKMLGVSDKKRAPADYTDAAEGFMQRYNEGDLFYVEKPSPKYILGTKGEYLNGPKLSPVGSNVASNEQYGSVAQEGSGEVRSYGQAQPGSVKATGIHYSGAERSNLDGRYYGTGARGDEAARVSAAPDPRIKERIYFYVDSGKGVTPEQNVGSIPHSVNLNNLYDGNADTWVQAKVSRDLQGNDWMNAFESAVIDSGFDGYVTDFGTQRAAVLLGRHNVQVTPGKSTAASQRKAPTTRPGDAVRNNRTLPMGAMTGADWKRMVPEASMLDDAKTYYKDQVAQALDGVKMSPVSQPVARFYSQLERAVEQMPAKVSGTSASNVKLWINSNKSKLGIKDDELQWSGLNEFLDLQGKNKVSAEEVVQYLQQNGVKVEEVEKRGPIMSTEDREDDTKYGQYVLPGGEDYRELLLTLPEKHVYPKTPVLTSEENRRFSELTQKMRRDGNLPAAEMADWKALKAQRDKHNNELEDISRAGQNQKPYRSSHWEEDNILAHIRFNDRTDADGKTTLFIEEIQGDWQQDYRKQADAIAREVDNNFQKIVERMKADGVLEVNCD